MVGADTSRGPRLHCFAASFGRDLARQLIQDYSPATGSILDPFCGSGTTLVEARRLGRTAIGIDTDPIAYLISCVQTRRYSLEWLNEFEEVCEEKLQHFEQALTFRMPRIASLRKGGSFGVNGTKAIVPTRDEVEYWFSPNQRAVLGSLVSLRDSFRETRKRDVLSVAISSVIVRKWPNTISCAMDIDHSRPHRTRPKPRTVYQNYKLFRRVLRQVFANLRNNLCEASDASVLKGDSAQVLKTKPSDETIDLVLSSPPYVNAIDYPRAHKFSEWWLSPDTADCAYDNYIGLRRSSTLPGSALPAEIFPNLVSSFDWLKKHAPSKYRLFTKYIVDMDAVVTGCRRALRPGGKIVFVVANNRINGRTIAIPQIIADLLSEAGYQGVATRARRIKTHLRRYPFGFPGRMSSESVVIAQKPLR